MIIINNFFKYYLNIFNFIIFLNKWKYFMMDTSIQTNNTELFKDMQNLYKNILISHIRLYYMF